VRDNHVVRIEGEHELIFGQSSATSKKSSANTE
jgi:hypothetical protein